MVCKHHTMSDRFFFVSALETRMYWNMFQCNPGVQRVSSGQEQSHCKENHQLSNLCEAMMC